MSGLMLLSLLVCYAACAALATPQQHLTHVVRLSCGQQQPTYVVHLPFGRRFCCGGLLSPLSVPAACAAGDSGVYGRNERVVVPILGDLMGMVGPGGLQFDRVSAQLGRLTESLAQLDDLSSRMQESDYAASSEDSTVTLRLSAIYFKTAPAQMDLTSKLMTALSAQQMAEATRCTARFEDAIQALEQGCRDSDKAQQIAAARVAQDQLAVYLQVVGERYIVQRIH